MPEPARCRRCGDPLRHQRSALPDPDGYPILGETPEVKGLWSAAAVWIKEGPGTARAVAEWMTHGNPEIDLGHSDIARFYPHQKTRGHVKARTGESFIKTYGIVHPSEQYLSGRDVRLAPMHASQKALGAVFYEAAGWERPHWYESNAGSVGEVRRSRDASRERVGRPLVVPHHQRRTPPDARDGRPGRPHGIRDLRRRRPQGDGDGSVDHRGAGRRQDRPRRLHPRAGLPWRLPLRPGR